jgi:hypothetical protein
MGVDLFIVWKTDVTPHITRIGEDQVDEKTKFTIYRPYSIVLALDHDSIRIH